MFDKEVVFTGKHADYLRHLAGSKQYKVEAVNKRRTFFKSNVDAILAGAVIGFVKQRKSAKDTSVNVQDNRIFLEALTNHKEELEFIYRIIMLLDRKDDFDINERVDKAFRYDADSKKRADGDKVFWEYVRGGIEYLYENLLADSDNTKQDIQNAIVFIEEYQECYYEEDMLGKILKISQEGFVQQG